MADLQDGQSVEMQGSGRTPYILKNVGGVYSCTCPAWRNQSVGIERRTCKHLRKLRGEQAEQERIGSPLPAAPLTKAAGESKVPALLLAETWANDLDLAGWWLSEKLDGVRAYWTGTQFLSRLGNVFHAPDWFVEGLPDVPLDGELWLDRKAFQRTVSIVRRQDKSDLWREIAYVVFDAPAVNEMFEARQEFLTDAFRKHAPPFARPLAQSRCQGLEHLQEELARVEALGGEGLMLRQPQSRYEAGRSATLLKVKTFHDAEARVIEHLAGQGRHKGRLGALAVELPDGTTFSVGTGFSDAQRENPPPVGSLITFRYQELSDRGVPRFPSFVRVRAGAPVAASQVESADKSRATRPKSPRPTSAQQPADPAPTTQEPNMSKRYFEFVDGKSSKFWEITQNGTDVTVRFGRIGTQGQTQTKSFGDEAEATQHAEKLIGEKTKKGYKEVK